MSRFIWNNWGETQRESVYNRVRARYGLDACPILSSDDVQEDDGDIVPAGAADHDYAVTPYPGAQDAAAARIQELEAEVRRLETKVMQLRIGHSLSQFQRFCASDEELRFYTRFPSEEVFLAFWKAIEPSASTLVYWSKAQKKGQTTEMEASQSYHRSLPLIDEFFLYCCRVSAGLQEKVLADIFKISLSTVSRTIITWANYLSLILGSLPIWMSRQEVNSTMPEKFRQFCPEVRVIIDCTEIRCQNPSSLTLQSEVFSSYKNTTTFKGLIGVAPCGPVTFVSSLFTGSISDQELTKQSGILDLLEPGDAWMADKGFTIKSMLAERGAKLIIPPFKTAAQFSKEDAERTQAIACLQIIVERAIRRVKEFHIWDTTVPLTMFGTVNQLWTNCCLMSNFQWPLDVKGLKSASCPSIHNLNMLSFSDCMNIRAFHLSKPETGICIRVINFDIRTGTKYFPERTLMSSWADPGSRSINLTSTGAQEKSWDVKMACSKLAIDKKRKVDFENREFKIEVNATFDDLLLHNNVRWLSKGKVLERFWALWKELETFLLDQKSAKAKLFVDFMKNEEEMEVVAFLTDITSHLNDLNLKLQGKNSTVCDLMSAVRAFQRKLEVFKCDLQQNLLHFPRLLDQTAGKHHRHNYAEFLEKLITNFQTRFEDFPLGKQVLLCIENPFLVKSIAEFSTEAMKVFPWANAATLQTELIELQENLALQESHCDPVTFWTKMVTAAGVPLLQKMALQILTMFPSTYCCESAFSTMNMVKHAYRSTLTNEHLHQCLRLALTPFKPKFKQLVAQRRCHLSH
ncbi:zinc finger protein 502-like isoform X2 [Labeo rohita]|uniref:Zinc finger protein 502-like isoform X2 n=1 Tax=Labeo rohita TaxID=84645 RepID=A0A498M8V2_LABRO|nr:zinc finger protein 502-like isoform X2 [Labeo rohita]